MFIQVIEGKTSDPEALHERLRVWERDVKPGAIGYLGSTGGCTSGGDCIVIARFEDEDSAKRNADRPEQTAWWLETEKLFDGTPAFHDTTDVQVMQHGSLDEAQFVQVMEGHVTDRARAETSMKESEPLLVESRPDLLGSVTAYYGDDEFTECAYFTNEAEAREREKQEMSPEMAESFREYQELWKVERYLDLKDPWLTTA